jgi:hypothetical protein
VSPSTYIGGTLALVAALAGGFGWIQTTRLAALDAKLKAKDATIERQAADIVQAVSVNRQNVKAYNDLKLEYDRREGVEEKFEKLQRDRAAKTVRNVQEIRNAPPAYDGPLAPILRQQLERMRAGEAGADLGDAAPNGAAVPPGGKAQVPDSAPASPGS